MTRGSKENFIINALFLGILFIIAYIIIKYLLVWLMPFVIGLILALLLQGPIKWLSKRLRISKKIVAILVTTITVALLVMATVLLANKVITEIVSFVSQIPSLFQDTIPAVFTAISDKLEDLLSGMPAEWETERNNYIQNFLTSSQEKLTTLSGTALTWLAGKAAAIPALLISIIVSIVSTFYISVGFDGIKQFFDKQLPHKYRAAIHDFQSTIGRTFGRIIQSYALLMLITFGELSLGLTILGVDYPILVAAITAVVDILPVLGTGTVLIPWGIIALILGDIPGGIGLLILYVIILIVRNILEPRIVGGRIGLNPLVTLIFMYLGLKLMGLPGLILFPITLILLKHAQDLGYFKLWKE